MPVPQQYQGGMQGGRPNMGGYGQMQIQPQQPQIDPRMQRQQAQQRFDPYNQPRSPWGQQQFNPTNRRW